MAKRVVTRGNTTFFTFPFYDEDDVLAILSSATVTLTYPGAIDFETETITLTNSDNTWVGEWDSSKSRPGWVEYHAHGLASGVSYDQDGRFRLTGNRANLDHDALPNSGTASSSAMGAPAALDYGE